MGLACKTKELQRQNRNYQQYSIYT